MPAIFTKEISFGLWDVGMLLDAGSNYRTIQAGNGPVNPLTLMLRDGSSAQDRAIANILTRT